LPILRCAHDRRLRTVPTEMQRSEYNFVNRWDVDSIPRSLD
jgi:hypothetical protein